MTEQRDHLYPRVVRAVLETPWAILPGTLAAILDLIALRARGERLSDEEIQARIGTGPPREDMQVAGGVAVIPIYGVITPKADMFTEMSGGTSVARLQSMFRDAIADKSVTAVALDIDSPGGQVDLIPELAAEMRAARGTKPIVAVANTVAASAAYWLGSQADEVVITPSGMAGSIGVFAAHDDISALQEKAGIKTTLISAGKYKTEGNPFEPLDEEAKAHIQSLVDESYAQFVNDVAKGRRVSVDTVRQDFGQGRLVTAKTAVSAGMADRVDTLEATVARLNRTARGNSTVAVAQLGTSSSAPATATLAVNGLAVAQSKPPPATDQDTAPEAAASGLSFADRVDDALRALDDVVAGAGTLRALTGTKRAQLSALIERANRLLELDQPDADSEPVVLGLDAEHDWQLATTRL